MTRYPLESLPAVSPLMVRRFAFGDLAFPAKGGLACAKAVECEEVGLATERLPYDEDVVDCSFAILALTTELMWLGAEAQRQQHGITMRVAYFNGRRWRSHRVGRELEWPDALLYIGNPIRIDATPSGLVVHRIPEFVIRSGVALQAEMEAQP